MLQRFLCLTTIRQWSGVELVLMQQIEHPSVTA